MGNILTGNGHTYTYGDTQGWEDLLTAVDGQAITYDAIGNPTSYYNGTRWTFGWEDGKELVTATDGTTNLSFAYDANGIRTTKTVGNVTHTYYYASGKLLREVYGNNTLDFFYDATGNAYALKYNGTVYYYITNLQGDVMQLVNADGVAVATYSYDPYGNVLTATGDLAEVNPLRYRGYYYDTETGLYYLQSRYYDPEIGRFLNADAYASTGEGILGNNMFAYCGNNPVMYSDPKGMWTITISAGYDVTLLLFGLAVSFGLAIDDDLNIVIQASYSAPSYLTEGEGFYLGLADAGISASVQVTDDDTVYDLEGPSCYAGCSVGVVKYASVDLVYSGVEAMDEENSDALPNGVQFNLGLGIGLDVHFRQSHTETIYVLH